MSLIRLVYASESRLVEANRDAEIGKLLASAQRSNLRNKVTGYLMITPIAFAQVIEGHQENVVETYGRIVIDPRHGSVRLLAEQTIPERNFAGWSMGASERDETTAFLFGLYGVTPENDLHQQPADALLDLAEQLSRLPQVSYSR